MSRANDEAHDRWFAQHLIECAGRFVVGAQVYRPKWDGIDTGRVCKVSRCRLDASGRPVESKHGEHVLYIALFGTSDYEMQTWAHRFFWDETSARKELIKLLRDRAKEKRCEADKIDELIAQLTALP